jgi:hypothetical protein
LTHIVIDLVAGEKKTESFDRTGCIDNKEDSMLGKAFHAARVSEGRVDRGESGYCSKL